MTNGADDTRAPDERPAIVLSKSAAFALAGPAGDLVGLLILKRCAATFQHADEGRSLLLHEIMTAARNADVTGCAVRARHHAACLIEVRAGDARAFLDRWPLAVQERLCVHRVSGSGVRAFTRLLSPYAGQSTYLETVIQGAFHPAAPASAVNGVAGAVRQFGSKAA